MKALLMLTSLLFSSASNAEQYPAAYLRSQYLIAVQKQCNAIENELYGTLKSHANGGYPIDFAMLEIPKTLIKESCSKKIIENAKNLGYSIEKMEMKPHVTYQSFKVSF